MHQRNFINPFETRSVFYILNSIQKMKSVLKGFSWQVQPFPYARLALQERPCFFFMIHQRLYRNASCPSEDDSSALSPLAAEAEGDLIDDDGSADSDTEKPKNWKTAKSPPDAAAVSGVDREVSNGHETPLYLGQTCRVGCVIAKHGCLMEALPIASHDMCKLFAFLGTPMDGGCVR